MNKFLTNTFSEQENFNSQLQACIQMINERERKIQDITSMKSEFKVMMDGCLSGDFSNSLHQAEGVLLNNLNQRYRKVQECKNIERNIKKTADRLIDLEYKNVHVIINTFLKKLDENQRNIIEINEKINLFEEGNNELTTEKQSL